MLVTHTNPVERHTVSFMFGRYYISFFDVNNWMRVVSTENKEDIPRLVEENTELTYKTNTYLSEPDNGDFDDIGHSHQASKYFGMNKHENDRL